MFHIEVIIFGWFLSKNITKTNFFKNKTDTELKHVQTDRFRFGSIILGKNNVQTGLTRFFPVLLGFFRFEFGSVGIFGFRLIKPKPNRTG